MLCYKDMTFCSSRLCTNRSCPSHYTKAEKNTTDLLIAWSDFSPGCEWKEGGGTVKKGKGGSMKGGKKGGKKC